VSLVEIDLVRAGRHTVAVDPDQLPRRSGTQAINCVSRARHPGRHEVYRVPIRDQLPAFRVPLREADPDVPLDLQPLVDRCYGTGRYWQLSHPGKVPEGFSPDERQ